MRDFQLWGLLASGPVIQSSQVDEIYQGHRIQNQSWISLDAIGTETDLA